MTSGNLQRLAVLLPGLCVFAPLSSQAQQSSSPPVMPVDRIISAGGAGNGEGWSSVGTIASRPALSLYENGKPVLVMTCASLEMKVQARGLTPEQAWPQPDLRLRFGETTRTRSPDLRNIGDQVAFEIEFRLADDVLDQIAAGAPISVDFNGQTRAFPSIPQSQRAAFAQGCKSLAPVGMRSAPR